MKRRVGFRRRRTVPLIGYESALVPEIEAPLGDPNPRTPPPYAETLRRNSPAHRR